MDMRLVHADQSDRIPAATDLLTCADLLTDAQPLRDWATVTRAWLVAEYGQAPDRTVFGYLLGWCLGVPAGVGARAFHVDRRVPSLRPAGLAFRLGRPSPVPEAVVVLTPEFTCLPGDPGAADPAARVVADETALAAVLRAEFVAHAARFLPAFCRTFATFAGVRVGRRSLWAAATDALDQALWVAGRERGNEAGGVADAGVVLPGRFAPLTAGSTLRPVCGAEAELSETDWTRRREVCCFRYLLDSGDGECRTCPRRTQPANRSVR